MAGNGVPVSPSTLKWARESAGLTVDEAAKLTAESAETIEAWEKGLLRPRLTAARHLAQVYRRPMAAFMLSQTPAEPPAPADFRKGVEAGRLSRDVRVAIRRAQRLQAIASDVFEALDMVPVLTSGSRTSAREPRQLASELRPMFDVSLLQQFSWANDYDALRAWRAAAGRLGVVVLQESLPPEEVRGFSLATTGPPVVVINASDAVRGRVFTLFHEISHIATGSSGVCLPEPQLVRPEGSLREESLCNSFAGVFLVPADALSAELQRLGIHARDLGSDLGLLRALGNRFRVSAQVIWYRLHETGAISDETFQSLWPDLRAAGRPARRASEKPPMITAARRKVSEMGGTLLVPLFEALDRGMLGPADLADWLDVRVGALPAVEKLLREPG